MKITDTRVGKSIEILEYGKRPYWYKVDIGADIKLGDSEDECIDLLTKKVDAAIERNTPAESETGSMEGYVRRGNGDMTFFNVTNQRAER